MTARSVRTADAPLLRRPPHVILLGCFPAVRSTAQCGPSTRARAVWIDAWGRNRSAWNEGDELCGEVPAQLHLRSSANGPTTFPPDFTQPVGIGTIAWPPPATEHENPCQMRRTPISRLSGWRRAVKRAAGPTSRRATARLAHCGVHHSVPMERGPSGQE